MTPDGELLARYAETGDEAAFAELVNRHLPLVYGTALRLLNGDAHLAQDVAQGVFADLARKAAELRRHPTLAGWLHTSTRFQASKAVRTEQRRRAREQEAAAMNEIATSPEIQWEQLRPLLDEAIAELSDEDRDAVLLRYFENKSFAEVGEILGLEPNTAHRRVARAVDKMRESFARTGITASATLLSTTLISQGATPLPDGLEATVTGAAVAGAAAKAASIASAAAKGAAATKATGLLGLFSALLGPLLGILAGLLGVQSGLRQAFSRNQPPTSAATTKEQRAAELAEWKIRRQEWREKNRARRQVRFDEVEKLLVGWRVLLIKPMLLLFATLTLLLAFALYIPDKQGQNPFFDKYHNLFFAGTVALIAATIWRLWVFLKATRAFKKQYGDPYRERRRLREPHFQRRLFIAPLILVAFVAMIFVPLHYLKANPVLATAIAVGLVFGFGYLNRGLIKLAKWSDREVLDSPPKPRRQPKEYRSPMVWLGLPLLHINFAPTTTGRQPLAKGWIAVGSRAVGLVAIGGTATGLLSIGPAAIGVVAIGGISLAPIAIGCLAIGHWAAGGVAIGTFATGGLAIASQTASGAFATAQDFASGNIAYAAHANDTAASAAVANGGFFNFIQTALHELWASAGIFVLFFVFAVVEVMARKLRQPTKKMAASGPSTESEVEGKDAAFTRRQSVFGLLLSAASVTGVLVLWYRLANDPAFPIPSILNFILVCLLFAFGFPGLMFLSQLYLSHSKAPADSLAEESDEEVEPTLAPAEPAAMLLPPQAADRSGAKPLVPVSKISIILTLVVVALLTLYYFSPQIQESDFGSGSLFGLIAGSIITTELFEAYQKAAKPKWKVLLPTVGKLSFILALWVMLCLIMDTYWNIALVAYVIVLAALRLGLGTRLGLNSLAWWKFILTVTSCASMILVYTYSGPSSPLHPSIFIGAFAAYVGHRLLFDDKYELIKKKPDSSTIEI